MRNLHSQSWIEGFFIIYGVSHAGPVILRKFIFSITFVISALMQQGGYRTEKWNVVRQSLEEREVHTAVSLFYH